MRVVYTRVSVGGFKAQRANPPPPPPPPASLFFDDRATFDKATEEVLAIDARQDSAKRWHVSSDEALAVVMAYWKREEELVSCEK